MFGSRIWKLAMIGTLAVAPAAISHAQKELVGEWQGTLNVQGQTLHILWHVTAAPDGVISSTFDNQDEGVTGIKVKSMELKGSDLTVAVADSVDAGGQEIQVAGVLTGKVNADFSEVTGTWAQTSPQDAEGDIDLKRTVQATDLKSKPEQAETAKPAPQPAASTDMDGTWQGSLDMGTMKLRVLFKFANTIDGLTGQLQSPDQSPNWLPMSSVTRNGDAITIEMKGIGASFAGKLSADKQAIEGTFTQMGNSLPLTVQRVKDAAA